MKGKRKNLAAPKFSLMHPCLKPSARIVARCQCPGLLRESTLAISGTMCKYTCLWYSVISGALSSSKRGGRDLLSGWQGSAAWEKRVCARASRTLSISTASFRAFVA